MRYYSPSTGGFYDAAIHGQDVPADAVKISAKKHASLLAAQATGATIVASSKGPIAQMPLQTRGEVLDAARRAVKREARRRILAIASLERQSNDNALLAQAALAVASDVSTTLDILPPLARREAIDAVRAASNAIEFELENMPTGELVEFRPAAAPWPAIEGVA